MTLEGIYEDYHERRKIQKRILNNKNLTYRFIIPLLDKYTEAKKTVLDLGCGTGALDFYLAKSGKRVTGLDISKRAIDNAKQNAKNFGFDKIINFFVAQFPNIVLIRKFDFIICSEILEHLSDDQVAVYKVYKLLRPRGIVIFSSPLRSSVLYRLGLARKFDKNVGHLRRYTPLGFRNLISNAGFEIIETKEVQGVFRDWLFMFNFGGSFVRIANRFSIFSDIFTFVDNLLLPLGASDMLVVARKK